MSGLVMVLIGACLIAYGLTVVWGSFFANSAFVQRRRAVYESRLWDVAQFGPSRALVIQPFGGVAALAIGVASLLPREWSPVAEALVLSAAGSMALVLVAFLVPAPFTPKWMKEADSRRGLKTQTDGSRDIPAR